LTFGVLVYAVFVALSYHYFFVRHRVEYVPDYRPSRVELATACKWSICGVLGNALLLLPIQLMIAHGWSRLYVGLAERGWPVLLLSSLGAVAVAETGVYWTHRMLHTDPFFRWFHRVHHQFREPNPAITYAVHDHRVSPSAALSPIHICLY